MAELKAARHEPIYMKDWLETLDKFSRDFGVGVLDSSELPDELTEVEKAYLNTLREMQRKLGARQEN
ncbi:hypothetical protein R83H12_00762 [Fibrobacteria bacterium R8-3-H12]